MAPLRLPCRLHLLWRLVEPQDADVGEVSVAFGVIETVADDELVGDFEADVFDLHGDEAA